MRNFTQSSQNITTGTDERSHFFQNKSEQSILRTTSLQNNEIDTPRSIIFDTIQIFGGTSLWKVVQTIMKLRWQLSAWTKKRVRIHKIVSRRIKCRDDLDPEKLEWLVWLSYNWTWYFAVHKHLEVNPLQMRHQESEDEPASRNREGWTPISDKWWSASRWTESWWEKSRPTWSEDVFIAVSHPGSGHYRVCDGVCTHLLPHAHFSATVCSL